MIVHAMQPTPAIIASNINSALDASSYSGAMPPQLRFHLRGCSVALHVRMGHLSVSVSASDGKTVIAYNGSTFAIADKAGNYASAFALALATDIAESLNRDNCRM